RMTGPKLARYTPTTITSRAKLRAELELTREQGFGVCRGEYESSAWGVSAPVLDSSGRPLAVLSIWAPGQPGTGDPVRRPRRARSGRGPRHRPPLTILRSSPTQTWCTNRPTPRRGQ